MDISEAEIQVLASLAKAEVEDLPCNRSALEAIGGRYWLFLEDWSGAFAKLKSMGLVDGSDDSYQLTASGLPIARKYHAERPDRYWYYYQKFYSAAYASPAHSRLCELAFGKDLCQDGQVDMADLHDLRDLLQMKPNESVLDLGCGAGLISKYISDQTQTLVTGLDYAASAVAEARARVSNDCGRLTYVQGDINKLEFPSQSFDAVISLDTLYWVSDLPKTLSDVSRILRPGGRVGIFYEQKKGDGDPVDILQQDRTQLGRALKDVGIQYEAINYTARSAAFWQRVWDAVNRLQGEFDLEGNGFIAASLLEEAGERFLPGFKAGTIARYLYLIRL